MDITGRCHCGKNEFRLKSEPEFQFICYCSSCRVLNSGGHLCGIIIDEKNFLAATRTETYTYKGGSENLIILHFCPTCATHLYAYPTEYKGKVAVRVNTLENMEFKPQQSLFTDTAFAWDKLFTVGIDQSH